MIALYRGTSLFPSRLIRWFSWSPYSHASWIDWTGTKSEYESWPTAGVQVVAQWGTNHTQGTRIDLFDLCVPLTAAENATLLRFFRSKIGMRYDWRGIMGFLLRFGAENPRRYFCSELVFEGLQEAGRTIIANREPYQVMPGMLAQSVALRYAGTIYVGRADIPVFLPAMGNRNVAPIGVS